MTCKNCGHSIEGKFCSNCGQTATIHRVTLSHFFHEMMHAITHADKGFLMLAKALLTRPGHIAREYLDGKRKRYFNPISFLVITTAISAFLIFEAGYYEALSHRDNTTSGATTGVSEPRQKSPDYKLSLLKKWWKANELSMRHNKLLELVVIYPLLAFFCWILFLRKINFAESLVLNAFLIGQLNIVTALIFIPAFLLAPQTVGINNHILHGVFVLYMVIAYQQFFSNHILLTILKSILIMILYVAFFWLVLIAYIALKEAITGV